MRASTPGFTTERATDAGVAMGKQIGELTGVNGREAPSIALANPALRTTE